MLVYLRTSIVTPVLFIYIFFFCSVISNRLLGTLWADMLAVSRGEVPSSEEISVVNSITVDWFLAPRRWGLDLKSNSANYPHHGHHGDPPPTRKNSHGRAGNLVVSSQKLWPPDHEAGLSHITWKYVLYTAGLQPVVHQLVLCGCQWRL